MVCVVEWAWLKSRDRGASKHLIHDWLHRLCHHSLHKSHWAPSHAQYHTHRSQALLGLLQQALIVLVTCMWHIYCVLFLYVSDEDPTTPDCHPTSTDKNVFSIPLNHFEGVVTNTTTSYNFVTKCPIKHFTRKHIQYFKIFLSIMC